MARITDMHMRINTTRQYILTSCINCFFRFRKCTGFCNQSEFSIFDSYIGLTEATF